MRAGSGRPNFGQACLRRGGPRRGLARGDHRVAGRGRRPGGRDRPVPRRRARAARGDARLVARLPAAQRARQPADRPRVPQAVALPISDLPARGRFAELGAADLRFELAETVALLQARFGRRIELDSCVRLHELTEGWPLGLQLAVSTIERSPDLQEAIAAFSVRSGDLHRYFVECLVDHLPPAAAEFLVRVSFVDALSPSLCEAITGQRAIRRAAGAVARVDADLRRRRRQRMVAHSSAGARVPRGALRRAAGVRTARVPRPRGALAGGATAFARKPRARCSMPG